jgi:hypothetical protein
MNKRNLIIISFISVALVAITFLSLGCGCDGGNIPPGTQAGHCMPDNIVCKYCFSRLSCNINSDTCRECDIECQRTQSGSGCACKWEEPVSDCMENSDCTGEEECITDQGYPYYCWSP